MHDAHKAERIRRGTQSEPDDHAARWLDGLIKTCVRDPDGESMGTRYDTLIPAVEGRLRAAGDRMGPRAPIAARVREGR
jgi:hypothetical protein